MQLRTELLINASPQKIWDILLDFRRYPDWNPFIVSVNGQAQLGSTLKVCVALPEDGSTHTFRPIITGYEPAERLVWLGQVGFPWLFSGRHFFELNPQADGSTRFVQGEDFTGILTKFLGRTLTLTGRGFVYMNQALKKRCESANAL